MKTRILAALVMLPATVAAIWFLSTPWLAALAALVLLAALREWYSLLGVRGLECTALLVLNLLLMTGLVWVSKGRLVLFQLAVFSGVLYWLLALSWLRRAQFGANGERLAHTLKRLPSSRPGPRWSCCTAKDRYGC